MRIKGKCVRNEQKKMSPVSFIAAKKLILYEWKMIHIVSKCEVMHCTAIRWHQNNRFPISIRIYAIPQFKKLFEYLFLRKQLRKVSSNKWTNTIVLQIWRVLFLFCSISFSFELIVLWLRQLCQSNVQMKFNFQQ